MRINFGIYSAAILTVNLLAMNSPAETIIPHEMSAQTRQCIECHATSSHAIYQDWGTSKHFRANVGCYECHQAQKGEPDAAKVEGAKALDSELKALLARPEHAWFTGKLPEEEKAKRKKAQEEFIGRYKK